MARKVPGLLRNGPWGPFLESPFSGVTIPFVSQERRGFKLSNFTVTFLFVTLKTRSKIGFPKKAVGTFTNGFSGPWLRETGHWTGDSGYKEHKIQINQN